MTKIVTIILIVIAALLTVIFFFSSPPKPEPLSFAQIGPFNVIYVDTNATFESASELIAGVRSYAQDSLNVKIRSSFMLVLDTTRKGDTDIFHFRAGVFTETLAQNVPAPMDTVVYPQVQAVISEYPLIDFLTRSADPFLFYSQAKTFAQTNNQTLGDHILEIADSSSRVVTFAAPLK